jgi:hypothetical protein
MNPSTDDVSSHRTGRLTAAEEEPLTALADIEAWKARKRYPSTLLAGGPVFGAAHERDDGGWELHPYFAGLAPQDARDALAAHLRLRARTAADRGEDKVAAACLAAAELLDREPLDTVDAGSERYRVVRAERFIRMGPDGPEPPRRSDPDSGADPAAGLVVHPADATRYGGAGVLRAELLAALRKKGTVPRDVHEDSRLAARSHPGGVLLPATFMAAEREGGRWRPHSTGTAATPSDARDGLALHLRVMVPWQQDLTAAEREVYKRAADRLDEQGCDELDVGGRHFRIVRVERLLRVGPDGPEGPRPSDADPVPPPLAHDPTAVEEDDAPPPEPDARTRKFLALFEEERTRRRNHP